MEPFKVFKKIGLGVLGGLFALPFPQVQSKANKDISNRSFVILNNPSVRMNLRNSRGVPMGTLGQGSIIQLPDGMSVYDSQGRLDVRETLRAWEQKTRSEPRLHPLKPRNCRGYKCFPIKVYRADPNSSVAKATIGYISLDFIEKNFRKHQYQSGRVARELEAYVSPSASGRRSPSPGADPEVTSPQSVSPQASSPYTQVSRQAIFNCSNRHYTSTRYRTTNCLKNLSLKGKAQLVMKDVLEINRRAKVHNQRAHFNLDPRFSVCIVYRESYISPNALSGRNRNGSRDYGAFQISGPTGAYVLKNEPPLTPYLTGIRSWPTYREQMIRSTLAQADIHHNVLYHKAKSLRYIGRINSGTESTETYRKLAYRYNGRGWRARKYAKAVSGCYACMKGIVHRSSQFKTGATDGKLTSCLRRATR